MSQKTYRRIERAIIALMLLGIAGMFQPIAIELYRYGFLLLLLSTILFIVISHVAPKPEVLDGPGPVSLEQAAERVHTQD
jgi:hypothetical protein